MMPRNRADGQILEFNSLNKIFHLDLLDNPECVKDTEMKEKGQQTGTVCQHLESLINQPGGMKKEELGVADMSVVAGRGFAN